MNKSVFAYCVALVLLAVGSPPALGADPTPTPAALAAFQHEQAGQKDQQNRRLDLASIPGKNNPSHPLRDVLSIYIDQGNLALCTKLPTVPVGYPVSSSEAAQLRADPAFLASCLNSKDSDIRRAVWTQLRSVTTLPLKFDPAAAPVDRATALTLVLEQLAAVKPTNKKP